MGIYARFRRLLGVLLKDLPRYRLALAKSGGQYLAICNRDERLEPSADGKAYRCLWQWTSDLHAPQVLPGLGLSLMKRALADHPVRRGTAPDAFAGAPDVSFIIGHRGMGRLPHLLLTLESIAGQQGASVECLVVEQDVEPHIAGHLPSWVRYIHSPPPTPDMAYCRSWAFNIGVKQARADVVVLHDNDMLVPVDYSAAVLEQVGRGAEVVNLKRFIFYLSEASTGQVFANEASLTEHSPQSIVQNLEGGGSVAISRRSYESIGGMDESFVGWGGEDNEFWERAQSLKVWPYSHLPLVHLWHAAQVGKQLTGSAPMMRYSELTRIPVPARIAHLRSLMTGKMSGPAGFDSCAA